MEIDTSFLDVRDRRDYFKGVVKNLRDGITITLGHASECDIRHLLSSYAFVRRMGDLVSKELEDDDAERLAKTYVKFHRSIVSALVNSCDCKKMNIV